MTDFSFGAQDQIKALLSQRMSEYQNAMDEISQAETEAIFADFAASAAEKRAGEYSQAVDRWEGIKASYNPVSIQNNVLTNLQFNIQNAEMLRDKMINQAKDEAIRKNSFKLLDSLTDKLDKRLKGLDEKIAKCEDVQQKAELIKKRDQLKSIITEAKEIKNIKNDKEAMRRFQGLAEKMYVSFNPDKSLTEEEKLQKLQTIKPKGEQCEDYFDSIAGIWGLYKEDITGAQKKLNSKIETIKRMGMIASPFAPGISAATNAAATAMQLANMPETVDLLQQRALYEKELKEMDQIKKSKDFKAMDKIDEKIKRVQEFNHQIRHCEFLDGNDGHENHGHGKNAESNIQTPDGIVFDQIINNATQIKETKTVFEEQIQQNFDFVSGIESDIYTNKSALKDISLKDTYHKQNVEKQADYMINKNGSDNSSKDDLIGKIASFIAGNSTDDAKVVLQKSLHALKDQLSDVFGDRVVVDKREGSRRSSTDRRLIGTGNEEQITENRDDVAGRRKGDRRQGNHIFISEETIKNLNIKS